MKTRIIILIMLLASLFLAACSNASVDDPVQAAVQPEAVETAQVEITMVAAQPSAEPQKPDSASVSGTLSAMQLALGTFKLDGTTHAISADQAADLIPLWKAIRFFNDSETTATQEIEAVLNQIQCSLTSEQLDTIEAMDLTVQDMGTIAGELGLDLGEAGSRFGNMDPEMQATMQSARESGQGSPEGMGVPGGGRGAGGENGLNQEAAQKAMAEGGGAAGAKIGMNPALLDAVIRFLEAK